MAQTPIKWADPEGFKERYGWEKSTQSKYRMLGKLPYYKIGKFIRYNIDEIDEWMLSHRVGVVL